MFSNFQHSALHSDSYSARATTAATTTALTKKNTRTAFLENLVIVREIAYKRRRVANSLANPISPLRRTLTALNLTCHVDALATGHSSIGRSRPSTPTRPWSPPSIPIRHTRLAGRREALFDRL